ncbi:MAG: hypothetical protein A2Z17_04405 [Gammaproteobacteria bacterium RBG_16_66_13]|nr:MAG: hypothetical protein A2Z17_04405 [Gammaproteobacteria bacterium RBG_16_66_13]
MRATTATRDGLATRPCLFCGELARVGAMWHGTGGELWACAGCIESEPQPFATLLADAIADRVNRDQCQRLQRALERFEAAAWRALALAMERA